MRHFVFGIPFLALVAACAELGGNQSGEPVLRSAEISLLAEDRFAVEIVAENMDGYEVARCLAAGFLAGKAEADQTEYPLYLRDGGKITDEFRVRDGVRTQTSSGVQTYTILTESRDSPDGKDLMSTEAQVARCTKRDLPISTGDAS